MRRRESYIASEIDSAYKRDMRMKKKYEAQREREAKEKGEKVRSDKEG